MRHQPIFAQAAAFLLALLIVCSLTLATHTAALATPDLPATRTGLACPPTIPTQPERCTDAKTTSEQTSLPETPPVEQTEITQAVQVEPPRDEPPAQLAFQVYLPLALSASATPACLSEPDAQELAALLVGDEGQKRVSLRCHPLLAQVAQARAEDMASRDYFSHVNPDGYGPNFLVRAAGYRLPDNYGNQAASNNIESIGAGHPTAASRWAGFLASPAHRTHLLGEAAFFQEQIDYGVGYAYREGSTYQRYWVIITAKPARSEQP